MERYNFDSWQYLDMDSKTSELEGVGKQKNTPHNTSPATLSGTQCLIECFILPSGILLMVHKAKAASCLMLL